LSPRQFIVKAVGALAFGLTVVGGAVCAADIELDMDLMQTIEDTNKSLASNISMQDAPKSTSDAKELHELFTKVEAHFVAKGDAKDAVDLSRQSVELTDAIVKSVGEKDFNKAQEAATTLSRTCRTCHTFYKKS
jgi:predicted transcriptional regulator YheO